MDADSSLRQPVSAHRYLRRRPCYPPRSPRFRGAWALLPDLNEPENGFGDSAIRVRVTLCAIGFVPALALAWVFELTPSGLQVARDLTRQAPAPPLGSLDRVVLALLALALGFFLVDRFLIEPVRQQEAVEVAYARGQSENARVDADEPSIVVLPLFPACW